MNQRSAYFRVGIGWVFLGLLLVPALSLGFMPVAMEAGLPKPGWLNAMLGIGSLFGYLLFLVLVLRFLEGRYRHCPRCAQAESSFEPIVKGCLANIYQCPRCHAEIRYLGLRELDVVERYEKTDYLP